MASTSFSLKFKFLTMVRKALFDNFFLILHIISSLLIAILIFLFFLGGTLSRPLHLSLDCSAFPAAVPLCLIILKDTKTTLVEAFSELLPKVSFPICSPHPDFFFILALMTIWNHFDIFFSILKSINTLLFSHPV